MDTLVSDLREEGLVSAWAVMINDPQAISQVHLLDPLNARIPAVQDTFPTGVWTPAVAALLRCVDGDELLFIDPDGHQTLKRFASSEFDLRRPADRARARDWMWQAASSASCGGCSPQYPALLTLQNECTAAGVTPLEFLTVSPSGAACLCRALQDAGLTMPILADGFPGLFGALAARRGELLLLDANGFIHHRLRVGTGVNRDLDLNLPADRARLVQWLQAIGPTRGADRS
jgi:hypothetical protein